MYKIIPEKLLKAKIHTSCQHIEINEESCIYDLTRLKRIFVDIPFINYNISTSGRTFRIEVNYIAWYNKNIKRVYWICTFCCKDWLMEIKKLKLK